MVFARNLPVALLVGVFAWGPPPGTVRAEIFAYREERGIIHFSNVPQGPRWVPLHVPSSAQSRRFDGSRQPQYPFANIVTAQAVAAGIEAGLVRAIIEVESNFDPRARSEKGALGLMQILPQTAERYGRFDLYEPEDNVRVGVRHLKLLLDRFGNDVRLALAAYNAGAGAVIRHGGVPPFPETIEYIGRVLGNYQGYRHLTPGDLLQVPGLGSRAYPLGHR